MQGQPVGYYIGAIKIMCEYMKGKMEKGILTKESVDVFLQSTAKNLNYPHLHEAFEAITECTQALYKYSKEKGFIDGDISYDDFMEEVFTDSSET